MSKTPKVPGNHVMYITVHVKFGNFVLLAVSENMTSILFVHSMYNETIIRLGF